MLTTLRLKPKPPFDFRGTARSHGWVVLAPNQWDDEPGSLTRVEQVKSGKVIRLLISNQGTVRAPAIQVEVGHRARLARRDREDVTERVAHMFRLDEDLRPFYALCRKRGAPWTKLTQGQGRMLRSSSLFEDIVKVICTTNIQWGGTIKMTAGLVEQFGDTCPSRPAQKAFPTPEAIAAMGLDEFAAQVSMGYRAPYIHGLARSIACDKLDLRALQDSSIPTVELRKRLRAIKGVGAYAAASLLMLLGRYDDLPIDSVCLDFTKRKYFGGRTPSHSDIRAIYEDWGEWKSLAYWFDRRLSRP